MATIKGNLLRKLHTQMGQCLDEFEASIAADKAGRAKDGVLDLSGAEPDTNTPESEGAQDSRPRRGKSMSEAFPGFDRIRK